MAHPAFAYLEIGQRPAAGDAVPGSLGFPALGQKHDEQSRSAFQENRHHLPSVLPPGVCCAASLAVGRGRRYIPYAAAEDRSGPQTRFIAFGNPLCWEATRAPPRSRDMGDVAFPHAMFLAQSDKSQGFGDGVPKGYGSTRKPDEPRFATPAVHFPLLGLPAGIADRHNRAATNVRPHSVPRSFAALRMTEWAPPTATKRSRHAVSGGRVFAFHRRRHTIQSKEKPCRSGGDG